MKKNQKIRINFITPIFIFILVMIIFALGLKLNPTNIPSVLVNKPTPYFSIPSLETEDKKLTNEMFIGEVNILNIFSSWCIPCLIEHPQMEKLSEYYKIPVYGINYKDKKEDCKKWLKKNGNPYQLIGLDPTGRTSIDLGSYGVPETFLIDKAGIIRYRHTGPVTKNDMDEIILPLVKKLND